MGFGNKPAVAAAPPAVAATNDNTEIMAKLDEISTVLFGVAKKLDLIAGQAQPATPAAPRAPRAAAPAAVAASTPAAAPAPVAAAPAAVGAYSKEQLDGMNRKQLSELAPSFSINPAQQKAEDLRTAILAAQGGGGAPAAVAAPAAAAVPRAAAATGSGVAKDTARRTALMQIIETNYEMFAEQVDPDSTAEDALKCGGDCLRCPNPEGHPTAAAQVLSCWESIHKALGVAPPAV